MDPFWEYTLIGINSIISAFFLCKCRLKSKEIKNIEDAVELDLTRSLKSLPPTSDYAMIRGTVKPLNNELESSFSSVKGVIRVFKVTEHVTKHSSNIAREATNELSKSVAYEPFNLFVNNKTKIEIVQALIADYLMDELEITHYNFEPLQQSIANKLVDRLLKDEITKGIETTEHMLKTNTTLYGYGQLVNTNGALKLLPPMKSGFKFILTKKDRHELINDLKWGKSMMKFFGLAMASITVGYFIYKMRKPFMIHYYNLRRKYEAKRIKKERERLAKEMKDLQELTGEQHQSSSSCVLCLTNPREVILLDCGHICLCVNCLELLRDKKCPICRVTYRKTARCFIP